MSKRGVAAGLWELDRLLRLHQLGFVAIWPLLGHAAVDGWSVRSLAGLLAASFCFNTFGTLTNDVLHLALDRRDPFKADRWLVRGKIAPGQVYLLAGLQIPIVAAVHLAAGFTPLSLVWIYAAFGGQGLYNLYCKACRVPPLAEAAEAAAASALVMYGATATGGVSTPIVWLTAAAGAAFIFLVNAFHSCLRDIEVEIACHQLTTPIWLGCTGVHQGAVHMSRAMTFYIGVWQSALVALSLAVAAQLSPEDGSDPGTFAAVLAAGALSGGLLIVLHRIRKPAWDDVMRFHLGTVPVPIMLAFGPRVGAQGMVMLALVYLGPSLLIVCGRLTRASAAVPMDALALNARRTRPDARSSS